VAAIFYFLIQLFLKLNDLINYFRLLLQYTSYSSFDTCRDIPDSIMLQETSHFKKSSEVVDTINTSRLTLNQDKESMQL